MDFDCWSWTAVQNNMPGPGEGGTLTINGICGKFPTDGYTLELRQRRGGINPWEPFFDLVVAPPSGPGAIDVLSDEPVTHVMSVSRDGKYTNVSIYFEDKLRWTVPVQQAA